MSKLKGDVHKELYKEIIIHCTMTPYNQPVTVEEIDAIHKRRVDVNSIAYNYVIHQDGTIEVGRPISRRAAHTVGHNNHSIGVCYIGGIGADGKPTDTRTDLQKYSMLNLLDELTHNFANTKISGHNQWSYVDCPCFDVPKWCKEVGLPYDDRVDRLPTHYQGIERI